MSFINRNCIPNNIMSVEKFDAIDANVKMLVSDPRNREIYTNLDVYIPRIDSRYTEEEIKFTFRAFGVGLVESADFVAVKDLETKEIKFYSAFIKMLEWNPIGNWINQMIRDKKSKVQISKSEFWMLLPAKTPLSRSKVNTHQLAAYTDELFVKVESVEKSITENMTVSSAHFNSLLAKTEEQASQIDHLLKIVEEQSSQLSRINAALFQEEPRKPRALTIEDLAVLIPDQNSKEKEKEKEKEKAPVYCDDECFFLKPLVITDTTTAKQKSMDVQSGTILFNFEDVLGPLAKSMGMTKEETRKGFNKEIANSKRAKSSSGYCGNA